MTRIPSLFSSRTVSEYLKDYGQILQKYFGPAALKAWAENAGITSRITFKQYMNGQRPLPESVQEHWVKALDLSASEQDLLKGSKSNSSLVSPPDVFFVPEDFFAGTANTLILNLCGIQSPMTEDNLVQLLKGVHSETAVRESLQNLLQLKLIERSSTGIFRRIFNGSLTTLPGRKSISSKEYFHQTYQLAEQAWEHSLTERELGAFTFRMNQADFAKAKDLIRHLKKELAALGAGEKSDSVYQCSIAAFPIYNPKTRPNTI